MVTRKELLDLIDNTLYEHRTGILHRHHIANQITAAMWPVLAEVWEEGYSKGYGDGFNENHVDPAFFNPYREIA